MKLEQIYLMPEVGEEDKDQEDPVEEVLVELVEVEMVDQHRQ